MGVCRLWTGARDSGQACLSKRLDLFCGIDLVYKRSYVSVFYRKRLVFCNGKTTKRGSNMALCRNPSCKKKHRGEFFCCDCMAALESYVDDLIDEITPESREFYIGRTNYPERRLLEHALFFGRTKLTVLHWAAEWDEIDYLESLFIERHQGRKSKNQTDEATGKKSGSFNACTSLGRKSQSNSRKN